MFVRKARYEAVAAALVAVTRRYEKLLRDWNALGGEAFLAAKSPDIALMREDVDELLKLCHPDKHGNSLAANVMTTRLLEIRQAHKSRETGHAG